MIAGFSFGALRNSERSLIEKIHFLKQIGSSALEIPFRDPGSLFNFKITEEIAKLLSSFDYLSIHAPYNLIIYRDDELSRKIMLKLEELTKQLPIKGIVFHPNNVEDFDFLKNFDLPILIENMDIRKDSFRNKEDIEQISNKYNFDFVLDLEHSFENDPTLKLTNDLIKIMGNRLKEIHLSGAKKSSKIIENNHCLLGDSIYRKELCSFLKILKNIPIILEVVVEKGQEEKLKDELNYLLEEKWK